MTSRKPGAERVQRWHDWYHSIAEAFAVGTQVLEVLDVDRSAEAQCAPSLLRDHFVVKPVELTQVSLKREQKEMCNLI